MDMDKVKSTLRQFVRDWSKEVYDLLFYDDVCVWKKVLKINKRVNVNVKQLMIPF